jgi:hypothetical protein
VSYLLGFSFNPIEFRWTANLARQGRPISEQMPQELQDKVDAVTRYLNFLVDALIVSSIAIWAHWISLGPARLGLQLADWKRDMLIGVTAGILLISAQALLLQRVPIDPRHAFTYRVRKGSSLLWLFIFISSAFSEELWIAFCLVVLRPATHSAAISVAITMALPQCCSLKAARNVFESFMNQCSPDRFLIFIVQDSRYEAVAGDTIRIGRHDSECSTIPS